ncbi:unnamed protein product [Symbiodinium natans]|uniref:Uncharacterized protein n=1 Tax=Symbiodinium natans TaxID=878477 RepID=A0A812P3X1_9DINO|nr:unnamed protein product [Symbiodinium natans]
MADISLARARIFLHLCIFYSIFFDPSTTRLHPLPFCTAEAGRGTFSYVAERDVKLGLEKTLTSHLLDALVPVIRDVRVDWGTGLDLTLQVTPDLGEMEYSNRFLAIALIQPSENECVQNRSTLEHVQVEAVVGGVQQSMRLLEVGMSTGTTLHAVGVSSYVRENQNALSESVQEVARVHRVATSATQWVRVLAQSKQAQAVVCDGLWSEPEPADPSATASHVSGELSQKEADKGHKGTLLSTRQHGAPSKHVVEKLSMVNFGKIATSLSLKDDAVFGVNQRSKVSETADEFRQKHLERTTEDWFRPRSTFSVRGFSRIGSALSIVGSSSGPSGRGSKPSPSAWQDPLRGENWPFIRGDDDFLTGYHDDVESYRAFDGRTKASKTSSPPELATRNTPSSRAKKAADLVSRLSVLDFSKLGHSLAFHGRRSQSPYSRLDSFSLFDSMMVGSSISSRHQGHQVKGQAGQNQGTLSMRSHIPFSKHGASDQSSSWAKLSATGAFNLASQLSIRLEKNLGKSRGVHAMQAGHASFADLSGLGRSVRDDYVERPDRAVSPAPAGPQAEDLSEIRGWISLEVAGGILQGVCPVKFTGEACSDVSERVAIHWRPGRNASHKPAQVYLTDMPLSLLSQGIRLGEASLSGSSKSSDNWPLELRIGLQVSKTCELSIHRVETSGSLGSKLMTSKLADATLHFQALSSQGSEERLSDLSDLSDLRAGIGEALGSRQQAVRQGFPTVARPVAVKAEASHAPRSTTWDPASVDMQAGCHALLGAQAFQGYFMLEQAALDAMGLSWKHLEMLMSLWTLHAADGAQVAHTAFALNVLKASFQEMQASWHLVARRAEAWLQHKVASLSLPGCRNAVACLETAGIFAVRERNKEKREPMTRYDRQPG